MSWKGHNTYWNQKSLRYLLDDTEYELFTFKAICPGEFVKFPIDDEYHPNKSFFFITKNKRYIDILNKKVQGDVENFSMAKFERFSALGFQK